MTRPLRRSHFTAWLVLTPVILVVLIAALAARAQSNVRLTKRPGTGAAMRETRP